jgi:hypothetical protein
VGKGDGFEREICRFLSKWWTDGKHDDVFWRNRVRATAKTPHAERQLGDITAVHTVGISLIETLNIELKTGYSKTRSGTRTKNIPWDLLDIIDGKPDGRKILLEFWEQCMSDAVMSGRIPMLICKRDYHQPIVCIEYSFYQQLADFLGYFSSTYIQLLAHPRMCIFRCDDFFQNYFRPEVVQLLKLPKKRKKLLKRKT